MQINVLAYLRYALAVLAAFASASITAQTTPLVDEGRAAISRGDSERAIGILEKAVVQSPNSAEAHFYLGSAYASEAQKGGMFGAARYIGKMTDQFKKAVALNPKYVDARYSLVQFYAAAPGIMGGSFDEAFEQAKQIKAIDSIAGHRANAFIYSQQKKADLAKKEYVDAIREQPDSAKARVYYAQYLANDEKNFPAAFAEIETALKADPNYMPAFYHLGRTAGLANTNLARGEEALKKYLGYTPKENEPASASAYYWLGMVYEKTGKTAAAKHSYQTALRLNPSLKLATEALKRVS